MSSAEVASSRSSILGSLQAEVLLFQINVHLSAFACVIKEAAKAQEICSYQAVKEYG